MIRKIIVTIIILLSVIHIYKPFRKMFYRMIAEQKVNLHILINNEVISSNLPKNFYVINLDRSSARMNLVREQSEKLGINLERFPATDGLDIIFKNNITKETFTGFDLKYNRNSLKANQQYAVYCSGDSYKSNQYDFIYLNNRPGSTTRFQEIRNLSAGEIGLNCSNYRLLKEIAQSDDQIAIILEDDILFSENFDVEIKNILNNLPKRWDLIYIDLLNFDTEEGKFWIKRRKRYNDFLYFFDDVTAVFPGTHALIINKQSSKKILKLFEGKNNLPWDLILIEGLFTRKLTTYFSDKRIATQNPNLESDIKEMGRK